MAFPQRLAEARCYCLGRDPGGGPDPRPGPRFEGSPALVSGLNECCSLGRASPEGCHSKSKEGLLYP